MKLNAISNLLTSDLMRAASQSPESHELWEKSVAVCKEYSALIDETVGRGSVLVLLHFLTVFHFEYFWANLVNGQFQCSLHQVWVVGHLGSIVEDKGRHIFVRVRFGPEDYKKGKRFFQTQKGSRLKSIAWYDLDIKFHGRQQRRPIRPSLKAVDRLGLVSTPLSITRQLQLSHSLLQNNSFYQQTNTALKYNLENSKKTFIRLISQIGQTNMRPGYYSEKLESVTWEVPSKYIIEYSLPGSKYWVECRAINKQTQEKVSIKRLQRPFYSPSKAVHTLDIIRLHQSLKHPNVCQFRELFTPQWANNFYKVYMVTSAMEHSLETAMKQNSLTVEMIQKIMYQVFSGLHYLHSRGVVLRDLQPSAIGIDQDCNVQIADLSSVTLEEGYRDFDQEFLTTHETWYCYKAPDVILDQRNYTAAVDVWAAGCIMAKMLLGRVFLNGCTLIEQLDLIIETLGKPSPQLLEEIASPDVCTYVQEKEGFSRKDFLRIFVDNSDSGTTAIGSLENTAIDVKNGNYVQERDTVDSFLWKDFPQIFGKAMDNLDGGLENSAVNVLDRIFVWDFRERITAKSLLAHPFFELYADPEDKPAPSTFITAATTNLKKLSLDSLKDIVYRSTIMS